MYRWEKELYKICCFIKAICFIKCLILEFRPQAEKQRKSDIDLLTVIKSFHSKSNKSPLLLLSYKDKSDTQNQVSSRIPLNHIQTDTYWKTHLIDI